MDTKAPHFLYQVLSHGRKLLLASPSQEEARELILKYPEVFPDPDMTSLMPESGHYLPANFYRETLDAQGQTELRAWPNAEHTEALLCPVTGRDGRHVGWTVDRKNALEPNGDLAKYTRARGGVKLEKERTVTVNYLYRDASNYKQYGFVSMFSALPEKVLEALTIKVEKCKDSEDFLPEDLNMPSLCLGNTEDDHCFHEITDFHIGEGVRQGEPYVKNFSFEEWATAFLQKSASGAWNTYDPSCDEEYSGPGLVRPSSEDVQKVVEDVKASLDEGIDCNLKSGNFAMKKDNNLTEEIPVLVGYMYRDAGNWKSRGMASLKSSLPEDVLRAIAQKVEACPSCENFVSEDMDIPSLRMGDTGQDHCFHELEYIEVGEKDFMSTGVPGVSFEEWSTQFLNLDKNNAWNTFDPMNTQYSGPGFVHPPQEEVQRLTAEMTEALTEKDSSAPQM